MKEITRINHIGLRVKNLNASRQFYQQLGFEFIAGPIGPEPVAIMEHPSGININFILNADSDCTENVLMDIAAKKYGLYSCCIRGNEYRICTKDYKSTGYYHY